MTTKITKTVLAILVCASVSGLCGCAWSIGGGKHDAATGPQPTVGQQLIDLKKAKDQGAITESEYEAQKKKLLSQ